MAVGAIGLAVAPSTALVASADREYSWTFDKDSRSLASPLPYIYEFEIEGMYQKSGSLKNPADIFIDSKGFVWVSDTGNNRVLKFTADGAYVSQLGSSDGPAKLTAPEGVYVTPQGDVWVADRGNARIVQFTASGDFVKQFGKPTSRLLADDQVYQPNKLVIDRRGYLYVLNGGGDFRGIFLLDSEGTFRGFFGANRLKFDLGRLFIRTFTTETQKKQISKVLPTHHANMFVDERGFIYTVSPLGNVDQIKKLNSIGNDVYTSGGRGYGEVERRAGQVIKPQFVDVTVDAQGIVSALDFNSGRIYQYDQSANLLAIFGGRGAQRGKFELPQSLAVGPNGRIYVLDANRNNIQAFRPTEFAELLQKGSRLHFDGKYQEAEAIWREVLRRDSNFELAHTGLAKAFFKRGEYVKAMQEYEVARDRNGWSLAFGELRHEFVREEFGWLLPATIGAIVLMIWTGRRIGTALMAMRFDDRGHGK
jgi:DNA-binding beta-propeller fold protein YncE